MVYLHITGTSSGRLVPDRYFSSTILETETSYLFFDCNEETVRYFNRLAFQRQPLPVYIFISHSHPDHISGLWVFLHYFHINKYTEQVHLFLPPGLFLDFEGLAAKHFIIQARLKFSLTPARLEHDQKADIGNLSVYAHKTSHLKKYEDYLLSPDEAFSFSVTSSGTGKVLWFTMDVATSDDINTQCPRHPVLLLADGSHLSDDELQEVCETVKPEAMMITHYDRANASDSISLARDGQIIGIPL